MVENPDSIVPAKRGHVALIFSKVAIMTSFFSRLKLCISRTERPVKFERQKFLHSGGAHNREMRTRECICEVHRTGADQEDSASFDIPLPLSHGPVFEPRTIYVEHYRAGVLAVACSSLELFRQAAYFV